MKIVQINDQTDLVLDEEQVESLVREVCRLEGIDGDELYLNFITKEKISDLHRDYFEDPSVTDCITFPLDGPRFVECVEGLKASPHIIGEVFVCPQVAFESCPHAPYEELSLYIVHTLLHLAGYNDIEEADTFEMRDAEKRILGYLYEKDLVLRQPMVL